MSTVCDCGTFGRVYSLAGALQQNGKGSSKEAAQLAFAELNNILSILLGFCAVDAPVAWLVFAMLAKVQHIRSVTT